MKKAELILERNYTQKRKQNMQVRRIYSLKNLRPKSISEPKIVLKK